MNFTKTLLTVFFLIVITTAKSQTSLPVSAPDTAKYPYWIQMMQDPNANFFQTQRAFSLYWQDRAITRGCGWKPFKRWENYMRTRVSPEGIIPAPDHTMKAYQDYMQRNDQPASLAGNWISQGPEILPNDKGYKGLGRINVVAFHPTDPNTVYVGSPSGGMWMSTMGGNYWTTTTDMLPTLGVSAIAVDPVNPATIYIGTGDRDASDAPGVGVMKSIDNGQTWTAANNGMGNVIISKLLIDPNSPATIYAASTSGIYKSVDGAATWVKYAGGNFKDLAFKPNSTTILYAAAGGNFYRSLDAGITWEQNMNGIANGTRGAVAVTPANPEIVYFVQTKSDNGFRGLYMSTDGGTTFTERSDSPNIMDWSCDGSGEGGQAWYDLAIAADPVNPNIIYVGGVDIWKSTDGGVTWNINGHWYGGCSVPAVHADHHYFAFNPLDNRLYIGNDGGAYWTGNGGSTWNEISNGLVISQAYKLAQSRTVDDVVVNGYQDNGTSVYDDGTWYAIGGGDGMECAVDPTDAMYRYTSLYYGSINRVYNTTGQGTIAGNGVNGITEEGAWVTPFLIDENDPNTMFIGYKNVWRSSNIKASNINTILWEKISELNTSNMNELEQSPANTDILYAASGNTLYRCNNAHTESPNWLNLSSNLPNTGAIADLEAHPFLENVVYLAQNKKVYKSTDQGYSWTDISGSLPDITINNIAYYRQSQEGLYIGTDAGVFYRENGMTDWIPFNNGMPANARVTEVEIYNDPVSPANDRIKASTYGRGMWKSDMYSNTPVTDFTADPLLIPYGCSVNFTDLSSGIPTEWHWSFPGGNPSTSTDKNPVGILYDTPGVYNVQLISGNSTGSDTLIKAGLIIVSDTLHPVAGFYATPRIFCDLFDIVTLTDTSEFCPYAWQWSINPTTFNFVNGTSATSRNPQISFTENGTYTVSLTVVNGNGISSVVKSDYIVAGGYTLPFAENFESADFGTKGWTTENPDNLTTWGITNVAGNTPGNKAAWMNFFDYLAPSGGRDRLISPALNFTGTNPVFLTFEHAYATRYASSSDSLVIYASNDCGTTWQRIFGAGEKGQGTFATTPKMTTSFVPSVADDWCGNGWGSACYLIDLSAYAGQQGIRLAFESYNRHANNLFIDNIAISRTTGIPETSATTTSFYAYPNPTNGLFTLVGGKQSEQGQLQIFNDQGSFVMSRVVNAGNNLVEQIDLTSFPKGIYLIRLAGNSSVKTCRVVLQ